MIHDVGNLKVRCLTCQEEKEIIRLIGVDLLFVVSCL